MTTTTLNAELPRAQTAARSPRLVRAELLKVRKRWGLVATTVVLTIVPMIIAYAVLALLHVANAAKHGPAGGAKNFADSLNFLAALTMVAGILVGGQGPGPVGGAHRSRGRRRPARRAPAQPPGRAGAGRRRRRRHPAVLTPLLRLRRRRWLKWKSLGRLH